MQEGNWSAKALIRAQNKSHVIHLDVNAIKDEKLRMDVTTPLGSHLASLAVTNDKVDYFLVKEKKFYTGRVSPRVLQPLLNISLDPRALHHILFDTPFAEKNWSCTRDERGYLAACKNLRQELEIQWSDRLGAKKTVKIIHPKAEIQLAFYDFKSNVDSQPGLFELKRPQGFRLIKLK